MGKNDYYFSDHLRLRMEQRGIMKQWVLAVIDEPDKTEYIADDEIHFFKKDALFKNKWLKVVLNPTTKVIVTAHFDRNMIKKIKNEDNL